MRVNIVNSVSIFLTLISDLYFIVIFLSLFFKLLQICYICILFMLRFCGMVCASKF